VIIMYNDRTCEMYSDRTARAGLGVAGRVGPETRVPKTIAETRDIEVLPEAYLVTRGRR
jgi:hypothetical protein